MLNLYAHLCLLHVVLVQLLMPPHVMFPPITVLLAHFTIYPLLSLMQPLLLIGFHNSCKFLLSPTCKHLSEFFVISSLQYDMVCTYFLENVLLLLPFVMLTGVATHQIGNPLVLTQFILAQMPFHGLARNSPRLPAHRQKLNIVPQAPPPLNFFGYNKSFTNLGSTFRNHQPSSPTILVQLIYVPARLSFPDETSSPTILVQLYYALSQLCLFTSCNHYRYICQLIVPAIFYSCCS